jgi:predicted TIM-barrel fold metal-dependent hydrolase
VTAEDAEQLAGHGAAYYLNRTSHTGTQPASTISDFDETTRDVLGADHVLMGTDWPIVVEKSVPERLQTAFAHCGLTAAEQQMIASGNTLRLLGVA